MDKEKGNILMFIHFYLSYLFYSYEDRGKFWTYHGISAY